MEQELYNLHINAGLKAGRDRTCGKKNAFDTEQKALKASESHNKWDKRKHDVEPYPCPFCEKWHIGGIMPIEVLKGLDK